MADLALKCNCGAIQGMARGISPRTAIRAVCYCDDCQAFARRLGRETGVLDEYGGTEVLQLIPPRIEITAGAEWLRCIRLTPKGLYRWYAACCSTPIANTVSARVPFAGLIHSFVDPAGRSDADPGPIRYRVQARHARSRPPYDGVYAGFPLRSYARLLPRLLLAMLRGRRMGKPFFDTQGRPVSEPVVLTMPTPAARKPDLGP